MPKVIQAAEFFVVGGPVQPDRLCYVERAADERAVAAIRGRKHCYVFGPRAIGKSSLLARVARNVRRSGGLAASVDLAQIEARGEHGNADRSIYSVAHKIVHELELNVDLATWWQEKSALSSDRRLADFFWEIVLTETTAPVVVLIDDLETVVGLPSAPELLGAIADCDARRHAEPDFRRLTFMLAGVVSLRQLMPRAVRAPFAEAEVVELGDFTPEESYQLALGLGGDQTQSQALMDRVCVWTNGHPYLTQKVARGVARKGGKLEDVERVVREQLLVPSALYDDAPLQSARAMLTAKTPSARQALRVLRKVSKGARVPMPKDPAVLDVLRLSGVVGVDAHGSVRYRNRVFKELFGGRWLRSTAPTRWGLWAAAALLLVALGGAAAYWYTHYLPIPYIRTLSSADADPAAVDDAYLRLHRLPGFGPLAEQLLGESLARRSGTATTLAAASATDERLRELPGQAERADELLAAFWLRKAEAAAQAEQRDAALLYGLRALDAEQRTAGSAPALLVDVIGDDYPALQRTVRIAEEPRNFSMDWPRNTLLWFDAANRLHRTPLDGRPLDSFTPMALTALQHTPVSLAQTVEGEGSAGAFEIRVAVRHPASNELELFVTAPSGAQESVVLPRGDPERVEEFVFAAVAGAALGSLADEGRRGSWRITLVDRLAGNAGELTSWAVKFGEDEWRNDVPEPVAIPDAVRTEAVTIETAHGFALVEPAEPSTVGTVALWNLAEARLLDDFMLSAPPEHVAINALGTRLLAAAGNTVTVWNVGDGLPVARLATQTELVLPPVFSADGAYLAIAERVEGAPPLYSVLSAVDGSLLTTIEGRDGADGWVLGPGARYLALLGPRNTVRVLDPRRGAELALLEHAHDTRMVRALRDGATVLTVDAAGDIRAWALEDGAPPVARLLGTATDPAAVAITADGLRIAYPAAGGRAAIRDIATGAQQGDVRLGTAAAVRVAVSEDGSTLVTSERDRLRIWAPAEAPLPAASPGVAATEITATGTDGTGNVAVLGFRRGQVRFAAPADLERGRSADLDFFGHASAVTSVAIDAARNVAASGGSDGSLRLWSVATHEPSDMVLRHPAAMPISAIAFASDGSRVAAAAEEIVAVWNAAEGTLAAERAVGAPITALRFVPGTNEIAIGDAAGNLSLVPLLDGAPPTVVRAGAAVTAAAVAAGGDVVAAATADGTLRLWRVRDRAELGAPQRLPSAVRRLAFAPDGRTLLSASDDWLHAFAVSDAGLEQRESRFSPLRLASSSALAALAGGGARLFGTDARGMLRSSLLLPGAGTAEAEPVASRVLERDWPELLGISLDSSGDLVEPGG
jgi:WD40 repeat protein/subtilisin-like proprotein convertase family protein